MDISEIQTLLRDAGWPIRVDGKMGPTIEKSETRQAVRDFQHGYTFIDLKVDGDPGSKTQDALLDCMKNKDGRRAGMCGEFFAFVEFKSKGNGWIKVHPRLVNRLDALRRTTGPVHIRSGYRDPDHNRRVGGAKSSQHVLGTAADINGKSYDVCRDLGFSGVGIAGDGSVIHVDVRAEGPNNTTGGRVGVPTVWHY